MGFLLFPVGVKGFDTPVGKLPLTSRTYKIIRSGIQNHMLLISKTQTSNLAEGSIILVDRQFSSF